MWNIRQQDRTSDQYPSLSASAYGSTRTHETRGHTNDDPLNLEVNRFDTEITIDHPSLSDPRYSPVRTHKFEADLDDSQSYMKGYTEGYRIGFADGFTAGKSSKF